MPSETIEDAPVRANPTNFATAIARLAANAARIALLLPLADMCDLDLSSDSRADRLPS